MSKYARQRGEADRALCTAVLHALKAHDCIISFEFSGRKPTVEWKDGGFARALQELLGNPRPFGLSKRSERGKLYLLLVEKDRARVDEIVIPGIMEQFGR
jgi:hypothetical protein